MSIKTNRKKTATKASEGAPPAPVPTTTKSAQTAAEGVAAPTATPATEHPIKSTSAEEEATTARRALARAILSTLPAAFAAFAVGAFALFARDVRAAVAVGPANPEKRSALLDVALETLVTGWPEGSPDLTGALFALSTALFLETPEGLVTLVRSGGEFHDGPVEEVLRRASEDLHDVGEALRFSPAAPDNTSAHARLTRVLYDVAAVGADQGDGELAMAAIMAQRVAAGEPQEAPNCLAVELGLALGELARQFKGDRLALRSRLADGLREQPKPWRPLDADSPARAKTAREMMTYSLRKMVRTAALVGRLGAEVDAALAAGGVPA